MKRWFVTIICIGLLVSLPAFAVDLGKTTVPLDGRRIANEETNLGNFVADAIKDASGADIAILHPMAFSSNTSGDILIPAGVIDEQTFRRVLAFPTSNIVTLKMTPAQLRNLMERSLAKYPDANMAFLQFSGMEVAFNTVQPASNRVTEIKINGKALDFFDNKTTYTVAMPAQLANGAAGYFSLFNPIQNTRKATDLTVIDAIIKEFGSATVSIKSTEPQVATITPKVEGRLKDTAKKDSPKDAGK